jgi:membrane AbrB-like protein
LSAVGGLVAQALDVPAGWVAGGLLAVAVASLAGVNTLFPARLQSPVFLLLGVYAGTGVTQDTLHQMQTWPASFAILVASIVGVVAGSTWWLHKRYGWARNDALLASMPGALSLVIAAAENLKADMKRVAIAQSLRVLILIEAIPLVAFLIGHPSGSPALAERRVASLLDIAVLLAAGAAASLVLRWLRLPGAWVIGGMLSTAILLLAGIVDAQLPNSIAVPAAIALAAITGSRFRPGDIVLLPRIAAASLGAFAIAVALSALGAFLVTLLFGVNIIQTLLAFAPGALEALTVLAFQMNIDPAYVAAHHVVRFVALVIAVPLLARWLARV